MANVGMQTVIDRLRRAVGGADGGADDTLLMARFATDRDPAAFEVLLVRHGPMVRAVCARILRHEQDAEDAFQATFLALAKSWATIGRGSLAGWLYRAAYHVALKAKARAARRKETDVAAGFRCGRGSRRVDRSRRTERRSSTRKSPDCRTAYG